MTDGKIIKEDRDSPGKPQLYIIKIGGNIIDDEPKLAAFLKDFAQIKGHKILVHGGGKMATSFAEKLNIPQQVQNGRRITDAETLKLVTMVYAGLINKSIVATLQANSCNAFGLCGADGNVISAHKRNRSSTIGEAGIDYGFVGDVDSVNHDLLQSLLSNQLTLVIAPVTHDLNGQLLNTNADTIAKEVAIALSTLNDVSLVYSFEKKGVLSNPADETSVIKNIDAGNYSKLKNTGAISAGMIPKLDNAFNALHAGVERVIIGDAMEIHQLIKREAGTIITT
ncbi:MAG: acetylglutamate kinase [Ginsengibacter sp.]